MTFFYDFDIKPSIDVIDTLEKFNFKGACIFYDSKTFNDKTIESFKNLNNQTSLDLYYGIKIDQTNVNLLRKDIQRYNNKTDLLMVKGGDPKINRVACESMMVDILSSPYLNKKNSGINHILARMAKENNITISIDFRHILKNHGYYRSHLLNQINQLMLLEKKYEFDIILTSASRSFYDVRSPESMILLSSLFNMDKDYAKRAISSNPEKIIKNIKEHKNMIIDGVKIVKED